jgi:hypothetical protein
MIIPQKQKQLLFRNLNFNIKYYGCNIENVIEYLVDKSFVLNMKSMFILLKVLQTFVNGFIIINKNCQIVSFGQFFKKLQIYLANNDFFVWLFRFRFLFKSGEKKLAKVLEVPK